MPDIDLSPVFLGSINNGGTGTTRGGAGGVQPGGRRMNLPGITGIFMATGLVSGKVWTYGPGTGTMLHLT